MARPVAQYRTSPYPHNSRKAGFAMQARRLKTPEEAFQITHDAGAETREAMRRIGGVMPVVDSISDARKRLQVSQTLLPRD